MAIGVSDLKELSIYKGSENALRLMNLLPGYKTNSTQNHLKSLNKLTKSENFLIGYYGTRGIVYFCNNRFVVYDHRKRKMLSRSREFKVDEASFSASKKNSIYITDLKDKNRLFRLDLKTRQTTEFSNTLNETVFGDFVIPSPEDTNFMTFKRCFSVALNRFKSSNPYSST